VGVPVTDSNPRPKIKLAVVVVRPDSVPEKSAAVPVATPKPVAVTALLIGLMDQ
jgi:hypothetical protein